MAPTSCRHSRRADKLPVNCICVLCFLCLANASFYSRDRESLAALISALTKFDGGVLVITHQREFSESICTEIWAMKDGLLVASGHNWVEGQG